MYSVNCMGSGRSRGQCDNCRAFKQTIHARTHAVRPDLKEQVNLKKVFWFRLYFLIRAILHFDMRHHRLFVTSFSSEFFNGFRRIKSSSFRRVHSMLMYMMISCRSITLPRRNMAHISQTASSLSCGILR